MSEKFPDPYRGSYNSDRYEISAGGSKYEEYAVRENDINSKGINSSNDGGNETGGTIVENDENYYREVYSLYSNVLDANGMNLLDPYMGYMTHFNKLQRLDVDPPYKGKTYIFFTRPDLNFWQMPTGIHNVETVDLFNYFSKTNIGVSVMPWLMFPNHMRLEFRNGKNIKDKNDKNYYIRTIRTRIGLTDIGDETNDKRFGNTAFTPFIPLLSNTCISSSGGQDLTLETKETEGDLHGNKLVYAKGADSSFTPGELSVEFSDIYGSPVLHMMNIWVHYIHYLTKNFVKTWERYIMYRILDYTCSIYVFETDRDNSTILRWSKYTGCFPKSVPLGNIQHNIDSDVGSLRQLSIPFAYNRCESMKPATLMDFNFLMNKFILDPDKKNQNKMLSMGVAPSKLIIPYDDYEINKVLSSDPGIIKPRHYEFYRGTKGDVKSVVVNDTDYYDNKFWGAMPYVMNHKLVWMDPKMIFKNFDTMYKRAQSVDTAARQAAKNLISG